MSDLPDGVDRLLDNVSLLRDTRIGSSVVVSGYGLLLVTGRNIRVTHSITGRDKIRIGLVLEGDVMAQEEAKP